MGSPSEISLPDILVRSPSGESDPRTLWQADKEKSVRATKTIDRDSGEERGSRVFFTRVNPFNGKLLEFCKRLTIRITKNREGAGPGFLFLKYN